MDTGLALTISESIYLIFMFFFFRTSYSFSSTHQDNATSLLGTWFIHNTGHRENKVCLFGKIMAFIYIILIFGRYYSKDTNVAYFTIVFSIISVILAYLMNLNVLIYICPLALTEFYILYYGL
jgi:hypothetical protein